MAQAKQCNRCARLYKNYEEQVSIPGARGGYNGLMLARISVDGNSFSRSGLLDLCPECMDLLVRWFKDGETKNTPGSM